MKLKKKLSSIFYLITGVFLAFLPKLLVCPIIGEMNPMRCWHVAQLEAIAGVGLIAAAAITHLIKSKKIKNLSHLLALGSCIVGISLPLIIGGCKNPLMMCHTIGYPAIYIICCSTVVFTLYQMSKNILREKLDFIKVRK